MKFNTDTMLSSNFRLYSDFIGYPNNILCITIFWFLLFMVQDWPRIIGAFSYYISSFPLMWTNFLVFHVFDNINIFEEPGAVIL